jgi:hypothetical protein
MFFRRKSTNHKAAKREFSLDIYKSLPLTPLFFAVVNYKDAISRVIMYRRYRNGLPTPRSSLYPWSIKSHTIHVPVTNFLPICIPSPKSSGTPPYALVDQSPRGSTCAREPNRCSQLVAACVTLMRKKTCMYTHIENSTQKFLSFRPSI